MRRSAPDPWSMRNTSENSSRPSSARRKSTRTSSLSRTAASSSSRRSRILTGTRRFSGISRLLGVVGSVNSLVILGAESLLMATFLRRGSGGGVPRGFYNVFHVISRHSSRTYCGRYC